MKHPLRLPANIIAVSAALLILANQVSNYIFASSYEQQKWALYIGFGAVILVLAGEQS